MAGGKEIRTRIQSVKNTQKITRAMEMVAASKMRKAQDRMALSRPYARKILQVIGHLAKGHPEYHHLYLNVRPIKRVGYIIVSSDRGLCGGLNTNLFKNVIQSMREHQQQQHEIDLCLIGVKAINFFRRIKANIVAQATHLGDEPRAAELIGIVKVMLDAYREGKVDAVYIAYNDFVNTMSQKPILERLLPIVAVDDKALDYHWDYIYEPDAKELLNALLTRYIESQVYQGVVENIASFQAAQMVAMKSATDNAGDLIERLQLAYNKERQAAITTEISEIIGGAEAV